MFFSSRFRLYPGLPASFLSRDCLLTLTYNSTPVEQNMSCPWCFGVCVSLLSLSLSGLTTPHPSMTEQKYLETINAESTRRVDVDEKNSQRLRDLSENMVLSLLCLYCLVVVFCAVNSTLLFWNKSCLVSTRLVSSSLLFSTSSNPEYP